MKQKTALITAEFDPTGVSRLEELGYAVHLTGWGETRQALSSNALCRLMPGVSLLITEVEEVPAQVIDAAPDLQVIAVCRARPVNVDLAAATARGIPVLCTPGRNADSVADFVVGLLLCLCRNISRAEHHLRSEGWMVAGNELPYFHFRGPELGGKTLGLIGYGAIGRALARRLRGFDMRVLIYDPYVDQTNEGELISLETVLRNADIVSVHVPDTTETRGLLNADRLALMKPTAYLINTARAAVVDEDALFDALAFGRLAGAALDVFWDEPNISHRWFTLDNVLLTPHLGGAADGVKIHHSAIILDDLQALSAGRMPTYLANPEALRAEDRH